MKRLLFIVFILLQVSCFHKKEKPATTKNSIPEKSTGITEITFNEEVHDFGTLVSGEIVVSTFTFTNSGKQNLIIKYIDAGCGCLQVKYPKTAVKPGKTGLIEVEFDSSGMFGRQYKTIEIHANCKEPKHLAIFAIVKNENLEIKY
jgi:hypothetical protein